MNAPAPLRIVYAGTPEFAVPALERLLASGFPPLAVLTQPDRPAGRGRKVQAGPVKQVALDAGIPVHQPGTLNGQEALRWLHGLRPDLLIVVAYGMILPKELLQVPDYGCWNIHASLLPRWRGAAPIQRAIEAGDTTSGVCIMQMDEGLDTGPILACRSTAIRADETGQSLHDRLALLGAELLLECVRHLARREPLTPEAQARQGVTYARKLEKSEARLDWTLDAVSLERKVRAFNPWPVAWCDLDGERTRIWTARASVEPCKDAPGSIVSASADGIDVATANGALRLLRLQRPGGRPLSAREYLNARRMQARPR